LEGIGQLHTQVSATNQTTHTISQELVLLRHGLMDKPKNSRNNTQIAKRGCANNLRKPTRPAMSREQSMASRYTSVFGRLVIRKVTQSTSFTDNEQRSESESYSTSATGWIFTPSFLSQCFEYQAFNACGAIQRAIRIYPVIPFNHPIWKMCLSGNLKGIQTMLSTRQVSLFSVDLNGYTLLHVRQSATLQKWKVLT